MITPGEIRTIALSLPEATEAPHFEKTSFRVLKKIFLTINVGEDRICVKLNEADQDVFSSYNRELIHPVPNKWGKHGWTLVALKGIPHEMYRDIIQTAYCSVAPPALVSLVEKPQDEE